MFSTLHRCCLSCCIYTSLTIQHPPRAILSTQLKGLGMFQGVSAHLVKRTMFCYVHGATDMRLDVQREMDKRYIPVNSSKTLLLYCKLNRAQLNPQKSVCLFSKLQPTAVGSQAARVFLCVCAKPVCQDRLVHVSL